MHTQKTSYDFSRNAELWKVDDTFLAHPGEKFHKISSPLIEATVEMWGQYMFDNVKTFPQEMLKFVDNFTRTLGIVSSKYTSVKDVCEAVLCRIDYEEPYFFLVDCLIQTSHNELLHTYRHKKTGDILNPARLETFKLELGWKFQPFYNVKMVMEQPKIVDFINKNIIPPQFGSREEALVALFSKIASIVWGDVKWLESMVEEAINSHTENLVYSEKTAHDERAHAEVTGSMDHDKLFWMAGALAVITWMKGPAALPFLTTYHQIYDQLLDIGDDGSVFPREGTGHEVIIDGCNIYTHEHLDFLPNQPADICRCCGVQTHCSKEINITALQHPTCSCGGTLDPMVVEEVYGYHNTRNCQAHRERYPIRTGFVCQRCIFVTVNQLGGHTKCGRSICPAVTCPHHLGPHARIQALTYQRTKQLTAPQRG